MAAPSVAGVATLLMDAVPALRERPAAVRARLMASAIRPDAFLDDLGAFALHNGDGPAPLQHRYGLGKVSARTAVLNRDRADGWTGGTAVIDLAGGQAAWHDVDVPPGASRLDIAMTWDEPPADTQVEAVLNDIDLWVDRDADCPPTDPCGEAASRSRRDNVEWLILRDPPPGVYRLKAVARRVHAEAPRVGLAWTVIRGPSTPELGISVPERVTATPARPFEVEVTVSTDGYVAAGTMLRVDCRADDSPVCSRLRWLAPKASSATREDAVERSLEHDPDSAIALGEVAAGERQAVRLVFVGVEDADRFRLHFTATAWNGRGATASVDVEVGTADAPSVAAATVPGNDDYTDAERLRGASGQRPVDLLLATPEPGEPPAISAPGAPTARPRSVWYAWTAPVTDRFRFSVDAGGPLGVADEIALDLFETAGGPLAGLGASELKVGGGLTFAAVAGRDYRLRLGLVDAFADADERRVVEPLTLRWSPAALPPNDAFAQATVVNGLEGAVAATNLGASVERGERAGGLLAATTWFRWTAPRDGDYAFEVDRRALAVAAFTGDDVAALRLVSGFPDLKAVFPARAGDEYRIVVTSRTAYASGNDYTLTWGPDTRLGAPNDDMDAAEPIPAGAPFHALTSDFQAATVEPGEPADTGVRTAWWRWTAPADGVWTWRAQRLQGAFVMNVFRVDPSAGTVRLAGTDPDAGTRLEFAFPAEAGADYHVSVGFPSDAPFERPFEDVLVVEWGPTPANDRRAAAATLSGAAGAVPGSTRFATVEAGEDAAGVGDGSLWWRWEAPSNGWFRFSLDYTFGGVVAVFSESADGGLDRLAVSRRVAGTPQAVFRAEAGGVYLVRVGSRPPFPGEGFVLGWERHGPPAWLRFVDILEDGDLDRAGGLVQIATPRALAFRPGGRELYASTADGLQLYLRDARTGGLRLGQTLAGVDNDAVLLWDAATESLLAGSCLGWQRIGRGGDGGLTDLGAIRPPTPCPGASVLSGADGALLTMVRPGAGLDVFRLDADRTRMARVGFVGVPGIQAAAVSNGGDHVYAATHGALHTFALDPSTGDLEPQGVVHGGSPAGGRVVEGLTGVQALAVDEADSTLFVFGTGGAGTAAFDLGEPSLPRFVDALPPFTASSTLSVSNVGFFEPETFNTGCGKGFVRPGRLVADMPCAFSAFTVQLLPGGILRAEDDLYVDGIDRHGGDVPDFEVTGGAAASPDGRHLYLGLERGLLVLERTRGLATSRRGRSERE